MNNQNSNIDNAFERFNAAAKTPESYSRSAAASCDLISSLQNLVQANEESKKGKFIGAQVDPLDRALTAVPEGS